MCFAIVYCMIAVIVLYLILVNIHVSCTDMHHAGQQAARDRIHRASCQYATPIRYDIPNSKLTAHAHYESRHVRLIWPLSVKPRLTTKGNYRPK